MVMLETTLLVYYAVIVVSLYGFFLFLWWWIKIRHASEVYIYVMLMFGAVAFEFMANATARIAFFHGEPYEFDAFLTGPIWKVKAVPILIVLLLIVTRMTRRIKMTITGKMEPDANPK